MQISEKNDIECFAILQSKHHNGGVGASQIVLYIV